MYLRENKNNSSKDISTFKSYINSEREVKNEIKEDFFDDK